MTRCVWLPGTLCDQRVFGSLPFCLGLANTFPDTTGFDRVERIAGHVLASVAGDLIVIGFSLGGFAALEMLRQAPERLRGVALVSGNAYPDPAANAPVRRAELVTAQEQGFEALIDAQWPRLVGPRSQTDAALRHRIVEMAQAVGQDGFARQIEMNITRPDLRGTAVDTPVPLLVVAGSEDAVCPRERYVQASSGENGHLVIIDGAGHFLPLESPKSLELIVTPFVQELAR